MNGIIEVNNLTKKYHRKYKGLKISALEKEGTENVTVALKGINMTVYEGEFLVIMGPSGAGKSTLLNMISTIDRKTKGSVTICGKNISNMNELDISKFRYEELGFIFQNFNVLNNLTVKENIILPLALANEEVSVIEEKLNRISNILNIEDILLKYPSECSGGQVQRIAAARALINDPKLIIADEPTGNLDTKNSHDLLELLRNLNSKDKKTIVMVTHDPMIGSYGDRLLYIRDGVIDKEVERKGISQKEYFYKIMDIVSKESMELFNEI